MKPHFIFSKLLCIVFLLICTHTNAQVTIGKDLAPKIGSLLDLKENDNINENSTKGMLLPRVALEDIAKMEPCVPSAQLADKQAHVGLTVYNVTDDASVGLCPGVYAWMETQWKRLPTPCESSVAPELLYSPNCYFVSPGQASEEIPVAKAYLVSESRSDMAALNKTHKQSLKILWQDTQNLIDKAEFVDGDRGIYSKIKVTAKGAATGNALVALHVGPNGNDTDPIAWSWHIWVTDYNPNTNTGGTTYTSNNGEKEYVFMDRNIGALNVTPTNTNSLGMLYQWGRKDPFTAADEYAAYSYSANFSHIFRPLYSHPANVVLDEINEEEDNTGIPKPSGTGIKHVVPPSGASNLERSVQNPVTFYYGSYVKNDNQALFDWYSGDGAGTIGDDGLWGTATQKSPFDPCPAGWRVPANSATLSPWAAYIPPTEWDDLEGVDLKNGNGFDFVGTASIAQLGYYPACFPRAPKAFYAGGFVGANDNNPNTVGGAFWLSAYEVSGVTKLIKSHYWTSTVDNNIKAKSMYMTPDPMMGGGSMEERPYSKATGAFVRCVKE